MDNTYRGVICHLCGNEVCQTCGCCFTSGCELNSCPETRLIDEFIRWAHDPQWAHAEEDIRLQLRMMLRASKD